MISKLVSNRFALVCNFLVGFLAFSMTMGISTHAQTPEDNGVKQENNGVKIELKLSPSRPEDPELANDPVPNNINLDSNNLKPSRPAVPDADESNVNDEQIVPRHSPFKFSSFQIVADKDVPKSSNVKPPARARDTNLSPNRKGIPSSALKKADGEAPAKLGYGVSKPKEVGPLSAKGSKAANMDDNEDAECPGGTESAHPLKAMPDDIPLQQEDHPYDAPAAESSAKPDRPAGRSPAQFNNEQLRLRTEINQLLRYYIQHPETTTRRSPWAVMHAILPFGVEAELSAGNRRVNAIGWMSYNGLCKTQRIFQPTKSGFRTNLGPGVQGHEGQFLAILAQSKVAPNYPIKVGTRSYTVNDLVKLEMATCREKSELTFKLLALSYYLDPNQRWRDNQGGSWSLEKLVAEELEQPVVGAACGGTHRLMGLTFSLQQRKRAGLPIDGHWERSEQFLNEFVAYAFSLQNPDGSFSTDWFEARANDPNVERKIQTTGHILEWLVYTVPDDQLQSPAIQKAVRFLLSTLGAEPERDWPIGPRGHSLRALALYNQRVFGAEPGKLKQYIANLNPESKRSELKQR